MRCARTFTSCTRYTCIEHSFSTQAIRTAATLRGKSVSKPRLGSKPTISNSKWGGGRDKEWAGPRADDADTFGDVESDVRACHPSRVFEQRSHCALFSAGAG